MIVNTAHRFPTRVPVVSGEGYARILTTPRLRRLLVPEGLWTSPYEVLDYTARLTLHDRRGLRATFARRQTVRFLQDGVGAVLDHAWGDGVLATDYRHTADRVLDAFRDRERYHLVVGLHQAMARGERLGFTVEREAMAGFTAETEWLETLIDHPVRRLRCAVIFPQRRPCRGAVLVSGSRQVVCPVRAGPDGRTVVRVRVRQPQAYRPYLLRWWW